MLSLSAGSSPRVNLERKVILIIMKNFFKIFGTLLLIFFVLMVIVLFGGLIFLKNLDIKKYKPQIVEAVGRVLDRAVDLKY